MISIWDVLRVVIAAPRESREVKDYLDQSIDHGDLERRIKTLQRKGKL